MTNNTQASQQVPSGDHDELEVKWARMFPNDNNSKHNALRFARALLAAQPSQAGGDGAKDAERYRWLRTQAPEAIDELGRLKTSVEFDAAIDAAIAAAGNKVEGE